MISCRLQHMADGFNHLADKTNEGLRIKNNRLAWPVGVPLFWQVKREC